MEGGQDIDRGPDMGKGTEHREGDRIWRERARLWKGESGYGKGNRI